jgi:hypothetical protein
VVLGSTTGRARSWHHLGFREDGSIRWNTPLDFADGVGAPGRSIRITEVGLMHIHTHALGHAPARD